MILILKYFIVKPYSNKRIDTALTVYVVIDTKNSKLPKTGHYTIVCTREVAYSGEGLTCVIYSLYIMNSSLNDLNSVQNTQICFLHVLYLTTVLEKMFSEKIFNYKK